MGPLWPSSVFLLVWQYPVIDLTFLLCESPLSEYSKLYTLPLHCSAKPAVENTNQEHEPVLVMFSKNSVHRLHGLF